MNSLFFKISSKYIVSVITKAHTINQDLPGVGMIEPKCKRSTELLLDPLAVNVKLFPVPTFKTK